MEGRVIKKDIIGTYNLPDYAVKWVTIIEQKGERYWTVNIGYMHKGKVYKLELKAVGELKGCIVFKVDNKEELKSNDKIEIIPMSDGNNDEEAERYILPFEGVD